MPFDDDLAAMVADAGDPITLAGQPGFALVDLQGEVVLDGIVTTATTADVLGTANAQMGQTLVHAGVSYIVRRVLPVEPDGALHRLVLAKE